MKQNQIIINANTTFDDTATHIQVYCNKSSRGDLYLSLNPAEISDEELDGRKYQLTSVHMMGLYDYHYIISKMPRYNQKKVDTVLQICKTYAPQITDAYIIADRNERKQRLDTLFAHIIAIA